MLSKNTLRLTGGILLIILIIFVFAYFGNALTHVEKLKSYVEPFGNYAPIIFIGFYIIITVAFAPGTIFTFLGGILFGPWYGTLYSVIGATIGAIISFFIARTIGQKFIKEHLAKKFPKVHEYDDKIEKHSFMVMLILRLLPFIPTNALNYLMGITKMNFKGFFWGTLLGNLPVTFAYANLAANATKVNSKEFYIAIVIFLGILCIPIILSRRLDKTKTL